MSSSSKLVDLSFSAFVGRIAAPGVAPASGSLAAATGALGASLASMAFRSASGESGASIPAYMKGRAEELDELAGVLLSHVDRDAEAYTAWRACSESTAGDETAAAEREKWRLESLEAPLETVEMSLAALRLVAVGTPECSPRLLSECDAAALALFAALEAGAAVCRANLKSFDEPLASDREAVLAVLVDEGRQRLASVREAARGATA